MWEVEDVGKRKGGEKGPAVDKSAPVDKWAEGDTLPQILHVWLVVVGYRTQCLPS